MASINQLFNFDVFSWMKKPKKRSPRQWPRVFFLNGRMAIVYVFLAALKFSGCDCLVDNSSAVQLPFVQH